MNEKLFTDADRLFRVESYDGELRIETFGPKILRFYVAICAAVIDKGRDVSTELAVDRVREMFSTVSRCELVRVSEDAVAFARHARRAALDSRYVRAFGDVTWRIRTFASNGHDLADVTANEGPFWNVALASANAVTSSVPGPKHFERHPDRSLRGSQRTRTNPERARTFTIAFDVGTCVRQATARATGQGRAFRKDTLPRARARLDFVLPTKSNARRKHVLRDVLCVTATTIAITSAFDEHRVPLHAVGKIVILERLLVVVEDRESTHVRGTLAQSARDAAVQLDAVRGDAVEDSASRTLPLERAVFRS